MHSRGLPQRRWLPEIDRFLRPFDGLLDRGPRHASTQRAARVYAAGLLLHAERKSMAPIADRLDGGEAHRLQHFITHATWDPTAVSERLVDAMAGTLRSPSALLVLDATSFPKQGTHSVGVARQYCGTLGKVANCQVAVTAALWTGVRAWMLGAALYLPEEWLTPEARQRVRIPTR